ncbi:hypothetical protein [Archangium lipolyticum]|uniref:hypothetical protein n=1 Tax=Archangium lipolyticum TaxID=2970465 RepID=UPI00214A2699|nr:hypothetical protein [Archangium lipolyticum]
MLRKVLATVLLLGALSGCTVPARTCTTDDDCRTNGGDGLCDTRVNLCYAGNKEVSGDQCNPACAPYEACTKSDGCVPRYTGLVVTPGDGGLVGGGAVTVRAELVADPTFELKFPETLSFSVARSDGGTGGSLGTVSGSAGVYTAQWTPPAGDGVFLLTAAYPDGGSPSTTVHLTVDATPPTFVVTVPPADAGTSGGGTTYGDPESGFANAWRRDQVLPVEIRTNDPNLEPSSLTVTLRGTDGGFAPAVPVTPFVSSQGCDSVFCGVAQVKLWEPPFNAFRGAMQIDVQGKDKAGNAGTGSSSVNMTRWKWVFDASTGGALIRTPAAIGAQGTIYVGTAAGSVGTVIAVQPEGRKQWELPVGAVVSGPLVGALSGGGIETVYVGINTSAGDAALVSINGSTGAERIRCSATSGQISSNLALQTTDAGIETAIAVANIGTEGSIRAIRPEASGEKCPVTGPVDLSQTIEGPGPLVVQNQFVFFSNDSYELTSYQFTNSNVRSGWPVPNASQVTGLALVGNDVVGAYGGARTQGAVLSISNSGSTTTPATPAWLYSSSGRTEQFVVGQNNVVFFGAGNLSGGKAGLAAITLGGSDIRAFPAGAGAFKSAPILGRDGALYAVGTEGTTGTVGAWSSDTLTNIWTLPGGVGLNALSPAMDCARDVSGVGRAEQVGVLYVPAGGKLYAFVVDSRGLDPDAPWPKYQHDSRNTGNPNTPISSCQ